MINVFSSAHLCLYMYYCIFLCNSHLTGDLLEHLVAQPEYKLLTVLNVPHMSDTAREFSTFQWASQVKHLRQMLIAGAHMEEGTYRTEYRFSNPSL